MKSFDAIVLGAGGMGSAAAYYLSKSGQQVLLLEQFELNHQRGSSYGYSRIIRYAYDHPIYIHLMRSAYSLWFELEAAANETLYMKTGGLDIGTPHQPSFQQLKTSMDTAGLPYEHLNRQALADRFPQFQLTDDTEALYSEATGMLAASRCVLAHIRLAQAQGTTVLDHTPVTQIIPRSESVEIVTPNDRFQAARLVITAGSWADTLLTDLGIHLPLTVLPCQLAFFEPDTPALYEPGQFPAFIFHQSIAAGDMPYGLPTHDGVGVKVSTFLGWPSVKHPDQVDYTPSLEWIEQLRQFLHDYLPGVNGRLVSTRRCLYTMTPDQHFVIDRHPEYHHIAIAAGFSGHGFKFTTLVGQILTDLLLDGHTNHDISLFRLFRW